MPYTCPTRARHVSCVFNVLLYLWCLLSNFDDLGVKMGVLEAKKWIGDSLTCPTCARHVSHVFDVLLYLWYHLLNFNDLGVKMGNKWTNVSF